MAVLHFKKWNFLRDPEHSGGANDDTWRKLDGARNVVDGNGTGTAQGWQQPSD
jgi:hypothetical protein